jgi:hypothetical protein
MIINDEKEKLFKLVRTLLGASVGKVELTDDQLCALFTVAVNDYSEITQNWLIKTRWGNLFTKNLSTTDITFALSTTSTDYEDSFTYAYSKQVGHQQRGPHELKKDFFMLEEGKQVYEVPAGRELNKVLWATPPSLTQSMLASSGGYNPELGASAPSIGTTNLYGSGGIGGSGGYYVAPVYDVLATSMDISLKNKILRSDLTYKVTAGPGGTRLVHLMNVPGVRNFTKTGIGGGYGMMGCAVWYHYYDINQGGGSCPTLDKDVILLPDQVPLEELDYFHFNQPTKNIIRKLIVADAKKLIAMVRGKFSGVLKIPDAEIIMDYKMLEQMGEKEREDVIKELKERLDDMDPNKMMELAAKRVDDLKKALVGTPNGLFIA